MPAGSAEQEVQSSFQQLVMDLGTVLEPSLSDESLYSQTVYIISLHWMTMTWTSARQWCR